MYYIKLFQDNTEYESDQPNFLHPHVSFIKDERRVVYEKTAPHDYSQDYLTFEALEDVTFQFTSGCSYSLDSGSTWTNLAANTSTPTVSAGNKIMFKANNIPSTSYGVGTFSSSGRFNAMGNPLSMIYGENFSGVTDLTTMYDALSRLFQACTNLVSAENISLPATTLTYNCYQYMFYGCTSLTTAPELPATTLVSSCYRNMFYNCTSLNYIKMLATDISASLCLYNWVTNVAATGTFTKNSAMSSLPTGADGIPSGWTVINN